MKKSGLAHWTWPSATRQSVIILFLSSLLIFSGVSVAEEAPTTEVRHFTNEAVAVPQKANELKIYKQAFEVTASVLCRVPRKGASLCKVDIGAEIEYQIEPELVLKYTSIMLDEQEFAADVTSSGEIEFRTNKVDYSGEQTFLVEVIYLK